MASLQGRYRQGPPGILCCPTTPAHSSPHQRTPESHKESPPPTPKITLQRWQLRLREATTWSGPHNRSVARSRIPRSASHMAKQSPTGVKNYLRGPRAGRLGVRLGQDSELAPAMAYQDRVCRAEMTIT